MTLEEASEIVMRGLVHQRTLATAVNRGALRGYRFGSRRILTTLADIHQWMQTKAITFFTQPTKRWRPNYDSWQDPDPSIRILELKMMLE